VTADAAKRFFATQFLIFGGAIVRNNAVLKKNSLLELCVLHAVTVEKSKHQDVVTDNKPSVLHIIVSPGHVSK
jgi:hypothetical protein